MDRGDIVYAICLECSHPVAEHQPAWGSKTGGGYGETYGCSVCNCQLSQNEKLRAWVGESAHEDAFGVLKALAELEARIVKLEAIILANEKQAAMAARVRRP